MTEFEKEPEILMQSNCALSVPVRVSSASASEQDSAGTVLAYPWQNHSSRKGTMPQEMQVLCVQHWAKFSADLASAMKTPSLDVNPKRQKDAQIHRKNLGVHSFGLWPK